MAKFEMDTEFVRKLAEILEEAHLGEIEMVDGERRIRIVTMDDDGRGRGHPIRPPP